jgi:lipoprotein-anchoring transpeptidase ErfK/SrfK
MTFLKHFQRRFGVAALGRPLALCSAILIGTVALGTDAQARRGEGVHVNVDVGGQKMEVYVDGRLKHRWPVSTGRDGYDTPGGSYKPQRLEKQWYSRKYDNAPMPNAVFFNGGYAIHGTTDVKRLGRAASHGCIRLHPSHAEQLYDLVEDHGSGRTRIVVDN